MVKEKLCSISDLVGDGARWCHLVSPGNENVALCGEDVSGEPWCSCSECRTCPDCERVDDALFKTFYMERFK